MTAGPDSHPAYPAYPRGTFVTDLITRRTGSLVYQHGGWLVLSRGIGPPWSAPSPFCREPSADEASELATALATYAELDWLPSNFPPLPPDRRSPCPHSS
ncbi:hypothetical protein [Streptomyces sp. NPDC002067]